MEHEGPVADLDGVSGVVSALIANHNVEPLGEQIDNLAFTFVAPLGAYDGDDHGFRILDFRSQKFQI
jgi:hypothetical protein